MKSVKSRICHVMALDVDPDIKATAIDFFKLYPDLPADLIYRLWCPAFQSIPTFSARNKDGTAKVFFDFYSRGRVECTRDFGGLTMYVTYRVNVDEIDVYGMLNRLRRSTTNKNNEST